MQNYQIYHNTRKIYVFNISLISICRCVLWSFVKHKSSSGEGLIRRQDDLSQQKKKNLGVWCRDTKKVTIHIANLPYMSGNVGPLADYSQQSQDVGLASWQQGHQLPPSMGPGVIGQRSIADFEAIEISWLQIWDGNISWQNMRPWNMHTWISHSIKTRNGPRATTKYGSQSNFFWRD